LFEADGSNTEIFYNHVLKKKEEKEKGKAEDEENDFPIYFMGCGGKQ
jgi:hypothetical protein